MSAQEQGHLSVPASEAAGASDSLIQQDGRDEARERDSYLPAEVMTMADRKQPDEPAQREHSGSAQDGVQSLEPVDSKSAETTDPGEPPSPPADSLSTRLGGLSVASPVPEPTRLPPDHDLPPPPPEKDDAYLTPNSRTPLASQSPTTVPAESSDTDWNEKQLPDVPGGPALEPEARSNGDPQGDEDSQSEIQSIMDQFTDPSRSTGEEEIMSPRLEFAEQFLGTPNHFPPRKSSLVDGRSVETSSHHTHGSISIHSPSSPADSHFTTSTAQSLPKNAIQDEISRTKHSRRSSTSTLPPPPPPEPEPDQPFDFHRFLEQLRHRTADPVAKFLRSFLTEFGKRQWMAHEQVKIISDFLAFITNKMAQCEVWREVSDSEFDNAKEGMEKLVMNRLYSQTFSPAIPPPPSIPRSTSRSKRRELERLHGPWRRGQHQEDIERDEILAQKIRIYSWVKEEHLDIPPVSPHGHRFLNLAQQEILKINGYRAPRDKVICILNCCKVIFGLLKNSKNADTSADSFVPLLIYVVLHANPDHLVSNVQYILRFRNQDKLGGEAGYYLSSLSGAIQFIETLDRTSLTVSDEEFEKNVEAAVSAIAEHNRQSEVHERSKREPPAAPRSQSTPRRSQESSRNLQARKESGRPSSDDDSAPVAGLLRTIQKPLSTIGRMFSDETDTTPERPTPPARMPPTAATPRLSPNMYQPPGTSGEETRTTDRLVTGSPQPRTRALDAQDAAAMQASAEDAEARRIQRAEHDGVVDTLANMFPNLDREVIDDVVKMKEGRVGQAVDACLALSVE